MLPTMLRVAASASALLAGALAAMPATFVDVPGGIFIQSFSVTPLPANLTLSMPNRLYGDADEWPYQQASIAPFAVQTTEVTNAQFEAFDPGHAAFRGMMNFSVGDDEPAVFVTWNDAVAYTAWLSARDNATYRLPTEAEAEWYIRAGTTTYYNTGDTFPYGKFQCDSWWPAAVDNRTCTAVVNLTVAEFPPNAYGLYDTHGNVEEWTSDWYAPYPAPAPCPGCPAPASGYPLPSTFRVTRGGSHSTDVYHLRSAARAGALPVDISWFIGIRVVREAAPGNRHAAWLARVLPRETAAACGLLLLEQEDASGADLACLGPRAADVLDRFRAGSAATLTVIAQPPAHPTTAFKQQQNHHHHQQRTPPATATAASAPTFLPPLKYVHVDSAFSIPYTTHNHDPALAICPNGDALAVWFSTITEPGREAGMVFSRLPANGTAWPPAQLWWHTPNRMESAPNMMWDAATGRVLAVWGTSAAATWGNLMVTLRTSADCGDTWSAPQVILPVHGLHHQPVNAFIRLQHQAAAGRPAAQGALLFTADNTTLGSGGTTVHLSLDNGTTWSDGWNANQEYILGIHGTLVELTNGSLLAFGRGNDINGMMAQSRTDDLGATWSYSASTFPGIHGGQRGIHLRLAEGPLMFCSFADVPMPVATQCGSARNATGLYCAVSLDEGDSWSYRRLVTEDGFGTMREQLDGQQFVANRVQSEMDGYCTARQGPDGMVHLISSRNHYRFNYAWLTALPPC